MRGVDLKMPEFEGSAADEFLVADLRRYENCVRASRYCGIIVRSAKVGSGWPASAKIALGSQRSLSGLNIAPYQFLAHRRLGAVEMCWPPLGEAGAQTR